MRATAYTSFNAFDGRRILDGFQRAGALYDSRVGHALCFLYLLYGIVLL